MGLPQDPSHGSGMQPWDFSAAGDKTAPSVCLGLKANYQSTNFIDFKSLLAEILPWG